MPFGNTKEDLGDQQVVFQKRKAPRYALNATVTVDGFDGEGELENISTSGCRMDSSTYVNLIPDDVYQVTINPNPSDNIKPFRLKLKASWTKSSELLFQAGFTLESGQSNAEMDRYVKVLNSKGIPPDYGNMVTGK